MPKAEDGGGIVIMMPDTVVFHTTSRGDDALTTAFYPIVVTKSKNKTKFDSHMIFFGLAEASSCRLDSLISQLSSKLQELFICRLLPGK
jgi:hypothetical protein